MSTSTAGGAGAVASSSSSSSNDSIPFLNTIRKVAATRRVTLSNTNKNDNQNDNVSGINTTTSIPVYAAGTSHNGGWDNNAFSDAVNVLGVKHVDTAHRYGSESNIGRILQQQQKREDENENDVFITSKFWPQHNSSSPSSSSSSVISLLSNDIITQATQSVKALNISTIDLYLLHFPSVVSSSRFPYGIQIPSEYRRCLWTALEDVFIMSNSNSNSNNKKLPFKLKSIGVSNYQIRHLRDILENNPNLRFSPSVNQIEVHPLCQQRELREYCSSKGIVVSAYCPLAKGELIRHRYVTDIVESINNSINNNNTIPPLTAAELLLRWSLEPTKNQIVISMSMNIQHQRSNSLALVVPLEERFPSSSSSSSLLEMFSNAFRQLNEMEGKFGKYNATWTSDQVA